MKLMKKVVTLLTLGIFFVTTTACANNSWAVKANTETLSTGVYVFYLMNAYQEAMQKLTLEGKETNDISSEQIEGQSAPNWIAEKAIKMCKRLLTVEKMFKDLNLSLSEEETTKAQETTDSAWETSGSMYEKNFGINKDAVHQASSLFNSKLEKIFNSIYGKDGSKAVTDEELNDFYKNNYVNIKFYSKIPYEENSESNEENTDDNKTEDEKSSETEDKTEGENNENSDVETKKVDTNESIQKEFDEYVAAINSGEKTVEQIRDIIKKNENITDDTDPLVEQIINPKSPGLTSEISNAIKNLEAGKATYIKFNDIYFLLIRSNSPVENPDLNDENKRKDLLNDMKYEEFEKQLDEDLNGLNFEINYVAVNQYNPIMFRNLVSA